MTPVRPIVGVAAVLLAAGIVAGCSQTVEGTATRAGSPDETAETRIPSPSTRSSTPRSTSPSRTPTAPPPSGEVASMTCAEYTDLSPEDQQAVIDEIVSSDGSLFGPGASEMAKSLADAMCQFLPTSTMGEILLGTPPR